MAVRFAKIGQHIAALSAKIETATAAATESQEDQAELRRELESLTEQVGAVSDRAESTLEVSTAAAADSESDQAELRGSLAALSEQVAGLAAEEVPNHSKALCMI